MTATTSSSNGLPAELHRLVNETRPALLERMAGQDGRDSADLADRVLREAELAQLDTRIEALELHLQRRALADAGSTAHAGQDQGQGKGHQDVAVRAGTVVSLSFAGAAPGRYLVADLLDVADAGASGEFDVLTPGSPLGRALLGARPGDQVTYLTPRGKVTVKVQAVE
jgi:transcription elongation factor GreA